MSKINKMPTAHQRKPQKMQFNNLIIKRDGDGNVTLELLDDPDLNHLSIEGFNKLQSHVEAMKRLDAFLHPDFLYNTFQNLFNSLNIGLEVNCFLDKYSYQKEEERKLELKAKRKPKIHKDEDE